MDKIILSSSDVETLLQWRDNNINLVRRSAAPFKGILLEFPETKINIKEINDGGRITFYIHINGTRAGKITGLQLPGGLFHISKNTTKLKSDDIQSILTVYASLMALIVYHDPEPATVAKPRTKSTGKAKQQRHKAKPGKTYILIAARGRLFHCPGSMQARRACSACAAIIGTIKTGERYGSSHIKKARGNKKIKLISYNRVKCPLSSRQRKNKKIFG